jgi:hypothetical protein
MHKAFFTLLFILLAMPYLSAQDESLEGREIMVKVDNRPDGDDRKSTLKMTLINKRGKERVREILTYSKDFGKDTKSIMYFQKPADVKGSGFLSWEYDDPDKDDDRWLYLPALKKVRRISGSSRNDYFMGSDFTYDDMGDRSVDEDTHILLREEEVEGKQCWVIESVPVDDDHMYSKVIRWIRQDALMAVKVEYYGRSVELMKILHVSDIRMQNGIWTAFRMHMDNLQEKHQTILEFNDVAYDLGVDDNVFKVSTLERGRLQ